MTFWLQGVDFVLGHPMAGREKEGIDFASAEVFLGANYLIVPRPGNREESIRLVEDLVQGSWGLAGSDASRRRSMIG